MIVARPGIAVLALVFLLGCANGAEPVPGPAPAPAMRDWAPYKDFVESVRLAGFHAMDPAKRDHIEMSLSLVPADKSIRPGDLRLTVMKDGREERIPVDEKGRLRLELDPALVAANPPIRINLPKGSKVGVGITLLARIATPERSSYADWTTALDQGNGVIREQAGALRFFLPTLRSFVVRFASGPQTIRLESGDRARTFTTDSRNEILFPRDPAFEKPGATVTMSARPLESELDDQRASD